jgi:iron-sulfur cluster repair protein YtfE (RIC family)
MTALTQPLRDEHQELIPHIERLRIVADMLDTAPTASVRQGIDEAYTFLTDHLIPHAQAEDQALYPVVARVMGAPEATATTRRDHVAVGQLTGELGDLRQSLPELGMTQTQATALRRVLYGLYALMQVHFVKEEEIYLPILDARLTAEEADRMFEAMEQAAHEAKHGRPA